MLAPHQIPTKEFLEQYFPIYTSSKLDGIRCLVFPDSLMSRNGKVIQNIHLWSLLSSLIDLAKSEQVIFDGEIWSPFLTFQKITSYTMSRNLFIPPESGLGYYIFDMLTVREWEEENERPFALRQQQLQKYDLRTNQIVLPQHTAPNWETISLLYEDELARGGEGLILRNPFGKYKHGRCTLREANMWKLKPFHTAEAKIIECLPLEVMRDNIERQYDSFGYLESARKKGDRETREALGSLVVENELGTFQIGVGFDFRGGEKDRTLLWNQRHELVGKTVSYKYMSIGMKSKPRFPVFLCFREEE
jgi:DNA ligase-1